MSMFLQDQILPVRVERYVYPMAVYRQREELKSATTGCGVPYVTTDGMLSTLRWCVVNWDSLGTVS